ncbi:MAG: hypothetical protein KGS61_06040 [Verrucomicrobia bacterium]|nr:hypothetical protein [Verrucomicrobiota bacterium]
MPKRFPLVYGALLGGWGIIVAWQVIEHYRLKETARVSLVHRSENIADIIRGIIGSASFRDVVIQDRLESALNRLLKPTELISVALLNAADEVVAYVGEPIDLEKMGMMQERVRWGQRAVTFISPIDLAGVSTSERGTNPPILLQPPRRGRTNGPREGMPPPPPPPPEERQERPGVREGGPRPDAATSSNAPAGARRERPGRRPPWLRGLSDQEYQSLIRKRTLHGLVMVMSTDSVQAASDQDFWLRWIISSFAAVAVTGLGLAWQNMTRSSELQMRLLRASELTSHLKEMNIAAAGLAHETRNPLNIIRGLAQMISKESAASEEIRKQSGAIADEVDRVTAQLNEFINYSKPREVRRAPVALAAVVGDVVRALKSDLEDKGIRLVQQTDNLAVQADEPLLRQVLFNLLINAVQAVDRGGEIQIAAGRRGSQEAYFEVRDDGQGVPLEQREQIFKPYFTTHQTGTGLGLAVVKQITLAHGWDLEFVPNEPRGAIFRVSRLKLSARG